MFKNYLNIWLLRNFKVNYQILRFAQKPQCCRSQLNSDYLSTSVFAIFTTTRSTKLLVLIHLTVFFHFSEKLNKKTQTELKFSFFQMGARERNVEMLRQKPETQKV